MYDKVHLWSYVNHALLEFDIVENRGCLINLDVKPSL
jgi:hypothetical protein